MLEQVRARRFRSNKRGPASGTLALLDFGNPRALVSTDTSHGATMAISVCHNMT